MRSKDDAWLFCYTKHDGARCATWIDLRRVVGLVYLEHRKILYVEGDVCAYEVDVSLEPDTFVGAVVGRVEAVTAVEK